MNSFQGAICIVKSHPWSPDMLAIVNAMAEAEGDADAGGVFGAFCHVQDYSLHAHVGAVHCKIGVAVQCHIWGARE